MDSPALREGDARFIQHCGRDVVLFRGFDGKPYVLDAYCSHMGGNLGVGGRVRDRNCIECPFHGWIYDGETGQCVLSDGEKRVSRKLDTFEYVNIERCSPLVTSSDRQSPVYLQKIADSQEIKLRRYECREVNGSIFVWYHADEQLRTKPLYELFDIQNEITRNGQEGRKFCVCRFTLIDSILVRGESINYVNCHIQEIPENGRIAWFTVRLSMDVLFRQRCAPFRFPP